jgi:hypothetical protein
MEADMLHEFSRLIFGRFGQKEFGLEETLCRSLRFEKNGGLYQVIQGQMSCWNCARSLAAFVLKGLERRSR